MALMQNRDYAEMRLASLIAIAAGLGLSGCASKPLNVPYNPTNFGPPDPVKIAKVPDVIVPGDKIHVTVFGVESLSGDFAVEENGQIDFPIIGVVQAQGQTPTGFAKVLEGRLSERTLENPNVQVAITEQAQQTITIEGAVNQPAVVPIRGQSSLLQAIALAHGTTQDAKPSQVVVFRQINGERMAAAFDLSAIRRAEAPDPTIYPNDVVVVGGSKNRQLVDSILRAIPIVGLFTRF